MSATNCCHCCTQLHQPCEWRKHLTHCTYCARSTGQKTHTKDWDFVDVNNRTGVAARRVFIGRRHVYTPSGYGKPWQYLFTSLPRLRLRAKIVEVASTIFAASLLCVTKRVRFQSEGTVFWHFCHCWPAMDANNDTFRNPRPRPRTASQMSKTIGQWHNCRPVLKDFSGTCHSRQSVFRTLFYVSCKQYK